jgi:alkyldihydroxyacetonephosphate synthase
MTQSVLGRALGDAVGATNVSREGSTFFVRPGAPPEVAQVLAIARERRVAVIPMGTGSLVSPPAGGTERERPQVVLDTRRMTNLLHLDELSHTVHAQAGIEIGALEEAVAARGLTLGDFPAETYRSTLGGLLAARAPGRATSRLGPIESACLGLSVVLADGRSLHVKAAPRRATGPDLMRLFLGSEGALGIITAAVLRVWRLPDSRIFTTCALPRVEAALEAARRTLVRGVRPAAMRVYDAEDAVASGLCEVDPAGQALLLATFSGHADLVEVERRVLETSVQQVGGTPLGAAPAERWWRGRGGPTAANAPTKTGPRFQVAAPLGRLGAVYRGVRASLLAAGAACHGFLGHFHEDGGCVYFAFPRSAEADEVAREAAAAAGGRPPSELEVDEPLVAALRALKKELDPDGILHGARLL